ncbi:MAG: hypothetical protein ACJ72N_16410 [Labedaea sp.]
MVWFGEVDLRVAAGPKSFVRGRELAAAVADVRHTAEGIEAVVRGAQPAAGADDGADEYKVFLGPASPGLIGECGCAEGGFCAHCVAVGLALLAEREPDADDAPDPAGLPRIGTMRRRLDAVLQVRGAVSRDGSPAYAEVAGEFLDTVAELVDSGHAAEARPLARVAVERITESLLLIDDGTGVVQATCQRALGLYARACAAARPNAGKLAGWLFRLQLDSPGWPAVDLADFAEALGDAGLAGYRALVDEAWDNRSGEIDIRRTLTVLLMRERLATFDGAPESLAEVLSAGLPDPAAFLGAGRDSTPWLGEFLVQAYLDSGRGAEALELRRFQLTARPTREQYAKLRDTAAYLGCWVDFRPWALEVLRDAPGELAGALLDDGAPDEAWAAAERAGCPRPAWLEVARRRAADHPADVLPGYRVLIEQAATGTGRRVYREVADLLRELREAATRAGELAGYRVLLAQLRARHRRRTAFLDELGRAQLD